MFLMCRSVTKSGKPSFWSSERRLLLADVISFTLGPFSNNFAHEARRMEREAEKLGLPLSAMPNAFSNPKTDEKFYLCFSLKFGRIGRTLDLMCPSRVELEAWIQALLFLCPAQPTWGSSFVFFLSLSLSLNFAASPLLLHKLVKVRC